jgi:hypothetical protein
MQLKKLLGIVVLGLLWCNVSFANYSILCNHQNLKTKVTLKNINNTWIIQVGNETWINKQTDEFGGVSTISVTEHEIELLYDHEIGTFHLLIDRDKNTMITTDGLNGRREWICK